MSDDFDCRSSKQRKITFYFKSNQRKITDYFRFRDSPHKIWHVAKKGQMQNLITRFPQLTEEIFGLLDYQTLVKCSEVNESWHNTAINQRLYWIQVICKYTNSKEEYHKQWMKATEKTPFDTLKRLAGLARDNCKIDPRWAIWDSILEREDESEPELSLFHILVSEGDIDLFKYVARKIGYKHMFATEKSRWDNRNEYTPLHEAASIGNFDICKFIIDQVNDKNPANDAGTTPFHMAANYYRDSSENDGHFEICQLIFEATGFQNPPNINGATPLHSAAYNGNLKICEMIVEKVDDKNPRNNCGETPLHSAAKEGHFEICQLIVEKVVMKNPRNNHGETPLHCAAEKCHLEICQLIIGKIEEKNPREDDYGYTPLHYAAENNNLEICKLIIGNIGENNPSDNRGTTPLHHAAKNSNLEICKLICEDIVDKNPKNNSGISPLDHAYEKKDPRVLYFLIGENNLQY